MVTRLCTNVMKGSRRCFFRLALVASSSCYRNALLASREAIWLGIRIVAKAAHLRNIQTGQLGLGRDTQAKEPLVEREEDPRDAEDVHKADDCTDDLCH